MRALGLILGLFLAGCTVEIRLAPRVQDLWVSSYYCTNRTTDLAYRFYLTAPATALEFRWSDRPDWPSAPPEGSLRVRVYLRPGEVWGSFQVDPEGRILGVVLVQGEGVGPQGVIVEPLPERWLWVRAGDGVWGPWASKGPVFPVDCPP